MSQIVTFLGSGGIYLSVLAVTAAKVAAQQGRRVLLTAHQTGLQLASILEVTLSADPTPIGPNLNVMEFKSTALLEKSWEQVKQLEADYSRSPFFKTIYGQELPIIPGMDQALVLDALRRLDDSGLYDCIIYAGPGDLSVLRMLGIPEVGSWYWRRATTAFLNSDLAKTLRPFAEPIIRAVTNIEITSLDDLPNQFGEARDLLVEGRTAVSDPNRVLAHLVTSEDLVDIQIARYLWGSAQMIGLTVGSVITPAASLNQTEFSPLPIRQVPPYQGEWAPLEEAMSTLFSPSTAPAPVTIDETQRQVKLFIPGFHKSQIELSQSGPEITVTAGDQRRNLYLPSSLADRQVSGAKFQDHYLIISFS